MTLDDVSPDMAERFLEAMEKTAEASGKIAVFMEHTDARLQGIEQTNQLQVRAMRNVVRRLKKSEDAKPDLLKGFVAAVIADRKLSDRYWRIVVVALGLIVALGQAFNVINLRTLLQRLLGTG